MLLEDINPISQEKLYHKDIGFPEGIKMPDGFNPVIRLRYGNHARQEAFEEKYGVLNLPQMIDIRKADVFEMGVTGRTVTKIVCRIPHDDQNDIILAIMPDSGFVKTVWANRKTDQHKTLNRSRYTDPRAMSKRRF